MPKEMKRNRSRSRVKHGKKHKHHSKRRKSKQRSSNSSGSALSDSPPTTSTNLIQVLEDRRQQSHMERKRQKEELKAKESLEEKRLRRLQEKEAKKLRRRERMGWDTEYQHYTNEDNPFGDSNLMSTFVWNKKLEKDGLKDVSIETVEMLSRQKLIENKLELEKVKKRRMEREQERQMRDQEIALEQRSKETAQFHEWERQEDKFHLEQARLRSEIRIRDGRAKPIDLLAQYLSNSKLEDAIEVQMHEPYVLLNGLEMKDLEDLLVDIHVYKGMEKGDNNDFWDDMIVIVECELNKLSKGINNDNQATISGRRDGIHQNVLRDVSEIFRGKNASQLEQLRNRIESKISQRLDGVDISYWENLLSQLKAYMARARLRDRHREILRSKLKMLKDINNHSVSSSIETGNGPEVDIAQTLLNSGEGISTTDFDEIVETGVGADIIAHVIELYEQGDYSPKYINEDDVIDGVAIVSHEENEERLENIRSQLYEKINEDLNMTQEEMKMRSEARKFSLSDEVEFSVESILEPSKTMTSDKYRPRKPRYFNRVHTGFEWNKYNQTHYDMDNPPPKIVQGYKFNIFYPDLIEKTITPQYHLTPCAENPDFAILRFRAGPPYEDIAFKIVNREWEFSYKRGFRCQFQNNIFQLWFHFKRYRYRR